MKFDVLVPPEDVLTAEMDNIHGGKDGNEQIVICIFWCCSIVFLQGKRGSWNYLSGTN